MNESAAATPRIISCDVFDTLLRRNGYAEPRRVGFVAERAAQKLRVERGILIPVATVRRARIDVQGYAYRAVDLLHPTGEVRFSRMMEAMAMLLGLDASAAEILAQAEIEVELTQLAPNTPLLAWLAEQEAAGVRIIAISDTWHDAATIRLLLDTLAPGHPVAQVYTSADLDATKRTAQIFPLVAAAESATIQSFLHIGDDEMADDVMARRAGVSARRIVTPWPIILRRRIDGLAARLNRAMPQY